MDKYEFNIKVEQLKKMVNKGDYETAMKIADGIDWKRVRNTSLLSLVSQVYEKNEDYQEAKDILLLAFERAPIGKRLLYKLGDLALKEENVEEAEAYYREFCDLAPEDPRQHLLRYKILKQKGAPAEQLANSLERYTEEELDEKWMFELASLYHKAGKETECVQLCDRIALMFGIGKYVDRAIALKQEIAPLTQYQQDLVNNRDKYEEKLRAVEQEYSGAVAEEDYEEETPDNTEESDEEGDLDAYGIEDVQELPEDDDDDTVETPAAPVVTAPAADMPDMANTRAAMAATLKEAEVEEKLAKEMSRMAKEEYTETETPMEQTRILHDIRSIMPAHQEEPEDDDEEEEIPLTVEEDQTPVEEEPEIEELFADDDDEEEEAEEEEPETKAANHLMIEAETPEKGLKVALEALKQIHAETGIKNQVVKIAAVKLNKRGIAAVADKLAGKDLLIEGAGELSESVLNELNDLMAADETGLIVVLIDTSSQMENLHRLHPTLATKFECIGSGEDELVKAVNQGLAKQTEAEEKAAKQLTETKAAGAKAEETPAAQTVQKTAEPEEDVPADDEEMDIDEFAQYACKYAGEIDCSITGKSMLALYERIEIMEEDGIPLTRNNAENLIEEAADKAEKPSFGKLITGVFSKKYDKEGLLILKEQHFIG